MFTEKLKAGDAVIVVTNFTKKPGTVTKISSSGQITVRVENAELKFNKKGNQINTPNFRKAHLILTK